MKRSRILRLPAILLTLALLLPGAAHALTLEEARTLLTETYIEPIPETVLSQSTIDDMLDALGDPYTVYFTPEEYASFLASMEDTALVGIGISSQVTAEGVLIEIAFEDSPAAEGGLQPGDLITAVDGTSLAGLDQSTISGLLQGEVGSPVTITYLRDGQSHSVHLIRQEIVIPATTADLLDGHIGFLDCSTFGSETFDHFTEGLEEYGEAADRWILDLTGNGGGSVSAAVDSIACFTGPAFLAYLRDSQGKYSVYASEQEALTAAPLIVLTDSASASASELYAAAIRDEEAGIVVGWRTYGKGVAQVLLDQDSHPSYFADGDALKVTAYRFYSPNGCTTNTVGVIPHLMVNPNLADDVAVLLSASEPDGTPRRLLRVDLVKQWYVDLDQALSEEYRSSFSALLEALPDSVRLWEGGGSPDDWTPTSAEVLAEIYGVAYTPRGFTDTADSPYADEIDTLATYFIVAGAGDGTYQPEAPLTRAQLCALLAQALNCKVSEDESSFSDVASDAWYAPSVNALADMGLVTGTGGNLFSPDDPVTHEQFITILSRLAGTLSTQFDSALLDRPEDALEDEALAPYASWAREGVWLLAMSQKDLLGGSASLLWEDLDVIDPTASTTREEAACLLYNLLSYTGVLPV